MRKSKQLAMVVLRRAVSRARWLARLIKHLPFVIKHKYQNKGQPDFIILPAIMKILNEIAMVFETAEQPKVSIIVPVYNKIEYTFNCLRAIHKNKSSKQSFEVIIVDDHSTDQTLQVLARIKGLRIITNQKNIGFLLSCNKAAEQARGEFLVFLNNDAMVKPGWLDWFLKTFENNVDAGLVGAKLLFPNGLLQEAGGTIGKDGSARNFGRMEDPYKPEYNCLREVDYCSGACLMIPRELFARLGGFDPIYSPAYYEDADLAFKVRAAGKKVYYQPNAVAIHYEGATSGTDLSRGVKSFQINNQAKFFAKWRLILVDQPVKRRC